MEIKDFLKLSTLIFIAIYIILVVWSFYNKRRYGKLERRKYPGITTKEDMLNLNILDEEIYEALQNNRVLVYEKKSNKNCR